MGLTFSLQAFFGSYESGEQLQKEQFQGRPLSICTQRLWVSFLPSKYLPILAATYRKVLVKPAV